MLITLLAAATESTSDGGSGLVAIGVAAVGALGVVATAFGPALTERAKRGRGAPAPTPPAPAPAETPVMSGAPSRTEQRSAPTLGISDRDADVFDALEESIRDLRAQRDAAQGELARVYRDTSIKIESLRDELTEARIAIAQLRAGRYTA